MHWRLLPVFWRHRAVAFDVSIWWFLASFQGVGETNGQNDATLWAALCQHDGVMVGIMSLRQLV